MQYQNDQCSAKEPRNLLAAVILTPLLALCSIAALNGGVAPTASGWAVVQTYLQSLISSDFVIALLFIAVIIGLWQVGRGKGWAFLEWVLGILIVAYILPASVVAGATAVPTAARMAQLHTIEAGQATTVQHQPRL